MDVSESSYYTEKRKPNVAHKKYFKRQVTLNKASTWWDRVAIASVETVDGLPGGRNSVWSCRRTRTGIGGAIPRSHVRAVSLVRRRRRAEHLARVSPWWPAPRKNNLFSIISVSIRRGWWQTISKMLRMLKEKWFVRKWEHVCEW
jgi:hypothetical protein